MLTGTIRDKRGYVRPGMRGLGVDYSSTGAQAGMLQTQQMQVMANWPQGNCPAGYRQNPGDGSCMLYGTAQSIQQQLQQNKNLVFGGPSSLNIPGSGAAFWLSQAGPVGQALMSFDPTSTQNRDPNNAGTNLTSAYTPLLTQQAVNARQYTNDQALQQATALVNALPSLSDYRSGSSSITSTQVSNAIFAAQAALLGGSDPTAAAQSAIADGPYSTANYQALVTSAVQAQPTITVAPQNQGYAGAPSGGLDYPCIPGVNGNGCIPAHTPGTLASDYLPLPTIVGSPEYIAYMKASTQVVPISSSGNYAGSPQAMAAGDGSMFVGSQVPNSPMALTTYAPDAAPTQGVPIIPVSQNTPAARLTSQTNVTSTTPSASSTPPATSPLQQSAQLSLPQSQLPTPTPGFPSASVSSGVQTIGGPVVAATAPAVDMSAGISSSDITDWITANPLLAAAAAVGVFMLLKK